MHEQSLLYTTFPDASSSGMSSFASGLIIYEAPLMILHCAEMLPELCGKLSRNMLLVSKKC